MKTISKENAGAAARMLAPPFSTRPEVVFANLVLREAGEAMYEEVDRAVQAAINHADKILSTLETGITLKGARAGLVWHIEGLIKDSLRRRLVIEVDDWWLGGC